MSIGSFDNAIVDQRTIGDVILYRSRYYTILVALVIPSLYDGGQYSAVFVALAIWYDGNWPIRRSRYDGDQYGAVQSQT